MKSRLTIQRQKKTKNSSDGCSSDHSGTQGKHYFLLYQIHHVFIVVVLAAFRELMGANLKLRQLQWGSLHPSHISFSILLRSCSLNFHWQAAFHWFSKSRSICDRSILAALDAADVAQTCHQPVQRSLARELRRHRFSLAATGSKLLNLPIQITNNQHQYNITLIYIIY